MNSKIFSLSLLGLISSALLPAYALAGEHVESGTTVWIEVSKESQQLPNGNVVERNMIRGLILADDPESVFHLAKETCSGSNVMDADGNWIASYGYGEILDADGDLAFYSYSNSDAGAIWTLIGGTGKFKGITGSGTAENLIFSDMRQAVHWTGTINMKD